MKLYLSGKMTGLEDHGFPIFNAEAERLRALGHEVINPAETQPSTDWVTCIKYDLDSVEECEGIALMDNWVDSYGAGVELLAAGRLQNKIYRSADIQEEGVMPREYKIDLSKLVLLLN
jgi:hypothetical protein